MAYDTLKAEIRQYIKTNGANEITGQILQNVLLDMVNAYPSLDGYATQLWVSNQLNDMATMTWVEQNFVQNSALNNYLPLTGGTMTGAITAGTLTTGKYSLEDTDIRFDYAVNGSAQYAQSIIISSTDQTITFMARGGALTGTVITIDSITSDSFIVSGGTSSEFLKADGSLDNNTYLSSADLSGYATETWVGNNYLALSGGTLTGSITAGALTTGKYSLEDTGIRFDYAVNGSAQYAQSIIISATDQAITFTTRGGALTGTVITIDNITSGGFIVSGGTSSEFLKADGSLDSNTYLTSAAISDMATQTWVGQQGFLTSVPSGYATETWVGNNYLALSGGTLTGSLNLGGHYLHFGYNIQTEYGLTPSEGVRIFSIKGAYMYTFDKTVIAPSFAVNGGTSSQFLKADGSVDSNTYLTSAAISDMATQTWVGQQGFLTSVPSGYATETWVGNNYLALSGGTLTGSITAGTLTTGKYSLEGTGISFDYAVNGSAQYAQSIIISATDQAITFTTRGGALTGTVITTDNITSGGFIVSNGTSSEFLKADGSLDSNTYLTSAAISDMATQTWVGQQGFLTSVPSGYATETWVGNNYLALSGGTMAGSLNLGGHYLHFGYNIQTEYGLTPSEGVRIFSIKGAYMYTFDKTVIAPSFAVNGGTSSQFLKADGSVDSNTYLTSAAISDMATQTWVGQQGFLTSVPSGYATETWVGNNYLALNGGTLKNTGNYSTDLYIIDGLDTYTNRIYADGDGLNIFSGNDLYLTASGDVQTGNNNNLYVYGTVYANSFQQTSDIRRKNIISDIGMAIDDIAKAPLFRFTMKDDDEATVRVGTSAQYWQTVIPEVVSQDKRGVLGLQYDVAALAGVITVAKRVVDHEQRIAELEKENALLKAKLNIN